MQHVQLFCVQTEKIIILWYLKFKQSIMDFLNSFPGLLFSSAIAYFKKDPTLDTFRAFLSLHKSINTAYEKYIKCKKPCGQCFFRTFLRAIYLVWIQKLKQPMITIKVLTENRTYYDFQGCLQTEKMSTSGQQSTHMIIRYITWSIKIFQVRYFYFVDKLP